MAKTKYVKTEKDYVEYVAFLYPNEYNETYWNVYFNESTFGIEGDRIDGLIEFLKELKKASK